MKRAGSIVFVVFGMAIAWPATEARSATLTVNPGDSIQAAVDAASPGDTVLVMPGNYTETHGGPAAVRITKRLNLVARKNRLEKVRILPGPGNLHGVLVEPENMGDPDVQRVKIKGFTIQGFPNNGIWLRHVNDFRIERNESIDNLENGIFPTLSANGLVKKNVSYGSEDSALWVEASENVRVIRNDLSGSPTGLEITVSKNIVAKRNEVHDNTIGIGLYHPNGASEDPLGDDGDWMIVGNHVYNNNTEGLAPPGSLPAELPPGGGILVLGVDRVTIRSNRIENNNFFGIGMIDWCTPLEGTSRDCDISPPVVQEFPEDNRFISNKLIGNGLNPPNNPFAPFASDILALVGPPFTETNCFSNNVAATTVPSPLSTFYPEC